MEAFADLGYQDKEFEVTNDYYEKGIHLPLFTFMKKEEAIYIINLIDNFYN